MDGGDIAGLIAAGVFAVLVGLLALPIIKLGRVFDELRLTIRSLNDGTTPLIDEVTRTVSTTNTQLEKVDGITSNVSDASANVSALSSLVASTVGQPLIKVASFSHGLRRAFTPQQGPSSPQPGASPSANHSTADGAAGSTRATAPTAAPATEHPASERPTSEGPGTVRDQI
ncbi:DUF948 domain-containing protein [Kocuria sp. CPCC 205235]|uniref:DUF948 domain-containing protein n=1 Tax=Kocuria sp. CPCC 205235 TaxID=3073549 RepID=UPI0021A34D3D|nr:DUF948 domain-containing protein [Kocuria carniphila]MCT1801467.1 DUF948 domain-containing protein [Kocuria carniphila]